MTSSGVGRVSAGGIAGTLLAAAVACGGATTPTQVPAAPPKPVVSAPLTPPPELATVDPPPALILSGYLTKPSASFATVRSWSKIATPQSEQLTELLLGEAVGPIWDFDQPVHFAVAAGRGRGAANSEKGRSKATAVGGLDPGMLAAVSVPVRSPDAARAALAEHFKLVAGENGIVRLQAPVSPSAHEGDDDDDDDELDVHRTCELSPAFGPASLRLVCAFGDEKALAELGPWLTRGMTRAPTSADLHVDFRMEPLKGALAEQGKMYGALIGGILGSSLPLPSLRDLVVSVVEDLTDFFVDIDTEAIDVTLSEPGPRAALTVHLSTAASTLARLLIGNADRNAPPPALFWQMPSDASFAGFARGVDDGLLAHGRGLVLKIVGEQLAHDGVPPTDRKAVVEALGKFAVSSPAVFASGVDADAFARAVAATSLSAAGDPAGDPSDPTAGWTAARQLFGWHLFEWDQPPAQVGGALRDLVSAWNRPSVAAIYRSKLKDVGSPSVRQMPMPKGRSWPKDSAHYVLEIQPPKAPAVAAAAPTAKSHGPAKPLAIHLLLLPDGQRTWVGIAADEAQAAAKLSAAVAGSGETLGSRADLAALKDATVGGAGFVTLGSLAASASTLAALAGATPKDIAGPAAEMAQLPQRGLSPWTFTSKAESSTAPASAVWTLQLPRGAIDDVLVLLLRHGGI